jgi:hypothetical protein
VTFLPAIHEGLSASTLNSQELIMDSRQPSSNGMLMNKILYARFLRGSSVSSTFNYTIILEINLVGQNGADEPTVTFITT